MLACGLAPSGREACASCSSREGSLIRSSIASRLARAAALRRSIARVVSSRRVIVSPVRRIDGPVLGGEVRAHPADVAGRLTDDPIGRTPPLGSRASSPRPKDRPQRMQRTRPLKTRPTPSGRLPSARAAPAPSRLHARVDSAPLRWGLVHEDRLELARDLPTVSCEELPWAHATDERRPREAERVGKARFHHIEERVQLLEVNGASGARRSRRVKPPIRRSDPQTLRRVVPKIGVRVRARPNRSCRRRRLTRVPLATLPSSFI